MKTGNFFKTLLLLVVLVVAGTHTHAQQILNNSTGTQWTYWFPALASPIITPRTFSLNGGDTLIDGKEFFMSDFILYTPEYEAYTLYLSEDSSGMYYYDPIRFEIRTLYDYTLQPGESYIIYPLIGEVTDSLVVTVDSIGMEPFGSEMLRVQYISTRSVSHQERQNHWILGESITNNNAVIVEHIGSLAFLLPQEVAWNDDFSIGICSFSSGDFFYHTNDTIDCNEPIVISVPEFVEQEVMIFPNPARDICNLVNKSNIGYKIFIRDFSGRLIYSCEVPSNGTCEINVNNYISGIYFVSFISSNNCRTQKIIVL